MEAELTDVFDRLIEALPDNPDEARGEMSLVNTRARLRMTTLYHFAALYGRLAVGTGNKVEDYGIGFYTKYGAESALDGRQRAVPAAYRRLNAANRDKMESIPVCTVPDALRQADGPSGR